jgi:hypothetical protein
VLAKKNWYRVPCAGDGVEVKDAIVTVNAQGAGDPEGAATTGELPQAAHKLLTVADNTPAIHVRRDRMT